MHKRQWMRAAPLGMLMMLAGCGTPGQGTANGTPTISGKPAICLSMVQIAPNRGKPKEQGPITPAEIAGLLTQDRPIERVRNWVGDTASTLTQVDKSNASLKSLCGS